MKRTIRGLVAMIVATVFLGLGVAWALPGWLPAWARIDFDRLASMAQLGGLPSAGAKAAAAEDEETKPAGNEGPKSERVVRLASAKLARRFGIETAEVTKERHAHRLAGNAEIVYDGRHMAEILSRVSGVLREVMVDLGQVVRQGDVLAVVESAQIGSAKVQFHTNREAVALAQATYDRTIRLTQQKAAPAKTELENRTALKG